MKEHSSLFLLPSSFNSQPSALKLQPSFFPQPSAFSLQPLFRPLPSSFFPLSVSSVLSV